MLAVLETQNKEAKRIKRPQLACLGLHRGGGRRPDLEAYSKSGGKMSSGAMG